jgi:DNA-binding NtrC family response regulator
VIAATNRDLKERIAEGGFLEDLYYRLNVVQIDVPPLRERREDISELTRFFLHRHALDSKRVIEDISDQALQCLQHYGWPGNVRELENAIERAVVLGEGDTIGLEDFPDAIALTETEAVTVSDYRHAVDGFRRSFVQRLLDEAGGNQSQAAEQMGLQRAYLSRLIKRLGLR